MTNSARPRLDRDGMIIFKLLLFYYYYYYYYNRCLEFGTTTTLESTTLCV